MKIVVSIVSYNTQDLIVNCLKDVYQQKFNGDLEVWVSDNNSLDDSVLEIEKKFPKVKIIRNEENLGFAKAQNQILKVAKGDIFIILNPDTKISPDIFSKIINFFEQNPKCGVMGPKILGFDKSLHSNGGDLPFGLSLVAWLYNFENFGVKTNFHRVDKEYFENPHKVGWVGGTLMAVKSEVFENVGYFNEDYFMYFEDVEFCFRVGKKFEVMIDPEIEILHKSGASSDNPRLKQWKGEYWGLIHFYENNWGGLASFFVRLLIYKSIILRIIAFSLMGKGSFVKTYGQVLISI